MFSRYDRVSIRALKKKKEKVKKKKTITKGVDLGYLGTGETKTSVTRSRRQV